MQTMMNVKLSRAVSVLLLSIILLQLLCSCKASQSNNISDNTTTVQTNGTVSTEKVNDYNTTPQIAAVKNLDWPDGQIFPTFPAGSGEIDVVYASDLTNDERITLTCLQGLVNAVETRFAVYTDTVQAWANEYGYVANKAKTVAERDDMIKKYVSEVSGVVLYDRKQASKCEDYINLATTVAGTMQAIPISKTLYKSWLSKGIELPVVEDLTDLEFTERLDIYQYLYDNYWEKCNKRILLIQDAEFYQMRDLASATGCAVVFLSCDTSDRYELRLFEKFFADMTPGESILMGWNGQEKELMTVAADFGLSCVPADYFYSPSLFSQAVDVEINAVPDMPELENKIYVAFYFSDGDNIQYNMNAMKEYWDNSKWYRGNLALNWTISPALYEVAPGMMNYYYNSATENDCFVCGPSGLGYTVPVNTFGATLGTTFRNDEYFAAYVNMTNRYLANTGLRVVTVWDNLTAVQRALYSDLGTYLYGLTVQNFTNGDLGLGYTGITNGMLVQQMTPAYFAKNAEGTTKLTELSEIQRAVKYLGYDGTFPVFVSCQVSVWAFHDVKEVIDFEQYLSDMYADIYGEDVVEFVRADHYYNLYYQANDMDYDLALRSDLKVYASSGDDSAENTIDGTQDTLWISDSAQDQYLVYDFGKSFSISELTLFFAESSGQGYTAEDNVKILDISVSDDGVNWTKITTHNTDSHDIEYVKFDGQYAGRYLKLTVVDPGQTGTAIIADVNIYGK